MKDENKLKIQLHFGWMQGRKWSKTTVRTVDGTIHPPEHSPPTKALLVLDGSLFFLKRTHRCSPPVYPGYLSASASTRSGDLIPVAAGSRRRPDYSPPPANSRINRQATSIKMNGLTTSSSFQLQPSRILRPPSSELLAMDVSLVINRQSF